MTVAEWLNMVKADAARRGGPELVAALEGLAKATEALRAGDWNEIARPTAQPGVRRGDPSASPEVRRGDPSGSPRETTNQ
ncbi:MAG: hypothetical protein ACRD2N_09070 [Vicinamibacterales bacterium]